MPDVMPQNGTEAAYVAFAMIDELVSILVTRNVIDASVAKQMFESVTERLLQMNNFDSQRAAKFIADRMPGKE